MAEHDDRLSLVRGTDLHADVVAKALLFDDLDPAVEAPGQKIAQELGEPVGARLVVRRRLHLDERAQVFDDPLAVPEHRVEEARHSHTC